MWHNPLTRECEIKLAKFEVFAELVEETLLNRAAELDARLSAEADKYPAEDRQEFFEYHAEDFLELADELPTILRYGVLTGADTALEVYLNNTCETYAEVHGATVGLADFHGTGIERARNYLKKVARIPFPDEQPEWTNIKRLHELRSAVVHADGYVAPSRTILRQWCETVSGARITSSGVITLDRQFTSFALSTYRSFVAKVDEACADLSLWHSVFPIEDA